MQREVQEQSLLEESRRSEEAKLASQRRVRQEHWSKVAGQQREEADKYRRYCAELKQFRAMEKEQGIHGAAPTFEQWELTLTRTDTAHRYDGDDAVRNGGSGDDFEDIVDGEGQACSDGEDEVRSCRPMELMRIMSAADPRNTWTPPPVQPSCSAAGDASTRPENIPSSALTTDTASKKKGSLASVRNDISSFNKDRKKKQERLDRDKRQASTSNTSNLPVDISGTDNNAVMSSEAVTAYSSICKLEWGNGVQLQSQMTEPKDEMTSLRALHRKQFEVSRKLRGVVEKLDGLLEERMVDYRGMLASDSGDISSSGRSVGAGEEAENVDEEREDLRLHIQQLQKSREDAIVKQIAVDTQVKLLHQKMTALSKALKNKEIEESVKSAGEERPDDPDNHFLPPIRRTS